MPASRAARPGRLVSSLLPIAAGLLYAAVMTLGFPPFDLWPLVVLAPMPLVFVASRPPRCEGTRSFWRRSRSALRLAALIALGALPFDLYEQQWVMDVSALGYTPLAAAMALFVGAFVVCLRVCWLSMPRLWFCMTVPIIWTGVEVLRGEVAFTGYPWYLLAHPLIARETLALPAAIVGTYGVSFLAATPAGVLADLLFPQPRRWGGAVGGAVACAGAFVVAPTFVPARPTGSAFRIGVVQTNLPQDNKIGWPYEERVSDFGHFLDLSRRAAATDPKPDVIAWPETMFPGAFIDPQAITAVHDAEREYRRGFPGLTGFYDDLLEFQKAIGVPMLIGAVGVDHARLVKTSDPDLPYRPEVDASYNSVCLLAHGQVEPERYDKVGLTPFGEVMPYIGLWPWLQNQLLALGANGMKFDLSAGGRPQGFRVPSRNPGSPEIGIATPICFEATKPRLCRWLVNAQGPGPKVIVNLTNDGWFGNFDPGRWQHLQIARWRAVELGVPVVRVANTGVSAAIDARGRLIRAGVENGTRVARVDGVLLADVIPGYGRTIYARFGDVLGWAALAGTFVLVLLSLVKRFSSAATAVSQSFEVPASSPVPEHPR